MSAKAGFFPWPLLHSEGKLSFFRRPFKGPESKIKGKSQTLLKCTQNLPEMFNSVLKKKQFYVDAPAIYRQCKVKMTFKSLNQISDRLGKRIAKLIEASNGKPNKDGDVVVAFVLREKDQDEKMIALIFAILKLGITFMALSPSSLATDFNWSINVVSPVLLIHGDSLSAQAEETIAGIKTIGKVEVISFQDLWEDVKANNVSLDNSVLNLSLKDSELWSEVGSTEKTVGIFLTSGTVSSPHAVRIGAREIINRINWQAKVFPMISSDAYALTSPPTNPSCLAQIFIPFLAGKPLSIISQIDQQIAESLQDRIAELKLTRLTLNPPCFENLVDYVSKNPNTVDKLASITHWVVSGGALKLETGRAFFRIFSGIYKAGVFLIAMYGNTEVLGEATYEVFLNGEDLEKKVSTIFGTLSVGVPIQNSSIAILDRLDQAVPLGGKGEVVISGSCLSSGGYVGQGVGIHSKFAVNQNGSSNSLEKYKSNILFRTGDIGRILLDHKGIRRLHLEGRFDNELLQTAGETVNLEQWTGEVLFTKLVDDVAVITYHRGRETQVIVAAVVLKEGATCAQILEKIHSRLGHLSNALVPTVFSVDKIPILDSGRIDKKRIREMFRKLLLECEESEWEQINLTLEDLKVAKFVCKAIALSTGHPLVLVIRGYNKGFWNMGTALSSVIVSKIFRDNGYQIRMKDFISTKSVGELVQLVQKSKGPFNPELPLQQNDFDEKFSFHKMTLDDEDRVVNFLKSDCPDRVLARANPHAVMSYWRGVIDSVRDLRLSIVAKLGTKVVGVIITGDSSYRLLTPKPPKDIAYGLEMLDACLTASKYEMWRKSTGHVARSYFAGVSSSGNLSQGEKVAIIEQLLSSTCILAHAANFASVVISTANPLLQEVAIHLQQFKSVLEFPVSRFKGKEGVRPFSYADDNHSVAVLIKNVVDSAPNSSQPSRAPSAMSTVTSSRSTKTDSMGNKSLSTMQSSQNHF